MASIRSLTRLGEEYKLEKARLLDREWLVGTPKSPDQITVLQWNCLADWASDAFPHVSPDYLRWEHRLPLIVAECLRSDPDVICLEEVDHFEDLKSAFVADYDGYCKLKGVNSDRPSRDGVAIFWKRAQMVPRGRADLHYSRLCQKPEMKQVLASPEFEFLTSVGDSVLVSISATHLKAKSGFDEQRELQCKAIANVLDMKKMTPDGLTVVCGDFNTDPDSIAIETLINEANSVALQSSYESVVANGSSGDPDWTTWKIREHVKKTTIDFMFHDTNSKWQPIDVWKIPDESQIDPDVALPCERYPSDHVALATKFELVR